MKIYYIHKLTEDKKGHILTLYRCTIENEVDNYIRFRAYKKDIVYSFGENENKEKYLKMLDGRHLDLDTSLIGSHIFYDFEKAKRFLLKKVFI